MVTSQDGIILTAPNTPANVITVTSGGVAVLDSERGAGGLKFDSGKLLFSTLTRGLALPLRAVAEVLTYGAKKYARNSWQTVPNAKVRYEDALDRHLNEWRSGKSHDEESGLHHLAHAACNVLFLLYFEMTGTGQ